MILVEIPRFEAILWHCQPDPQRLHRVIELVHAFRIQNRKDVSMAAAEHEASRGYHVLCADAVRRLLIPLDAESCEMLDTLVRHFYPTHHRVQQNKYRGLVIEMALRALYQRTAPKQEKSS